MRIRDIIHRYITTESAGGPPLARVAQRAAGGWPHGAGRNTRARVEGGKVGGPPERTLPPEAAASQSTCTPPHPTCLLPNLDPPARQPAYLTPHEARQPTQLPGGAGRAGRRSEGAWGGRGIAKKGPA